jgi:hypothetical protein
MGRKVNSNFSKLTHLPGFQNCAVVFIDKRPEVKMQGPGPTNKTIAIEETVYRRGAKGRAERHKDNSAGDH